MEEKRQAIARTIIIGGISAVFTLAALVTAGQTFGFERYLLVAAAMVWGAIGITACLVNLSPHGYYGRLGVWVSQFMEDESDPR